MALVRLAPIGERQVGGDRGKAALVALADEVLKVVVLGEPQRLEAEVLDDRQIDAVDALEAPLVGANGAGGAWVLEHRLGEQALDRGPAGRADGVGLAALPLRVAQLVRQGLPRAACDRRPWSAHPRVRGHQLVLGVQTHGGGTGPQPQAVARLGAGDTPKGIQELEQLLEMAPGKEEEASRILLILSYLRAGEAEKALEAARSVHQAYPDNADALTLEGIAQSMLGQEERARDAFARALEQRPGDPNTALNLAVYALADEGLGRARSLYREILEHNPEHLLMLAEGRPQDAVEWFREAFSQRANNFLAIKVATAQTRAGDVDGAYDTLRNWLASHPEDMTTRAVLGDWLVSRQRWLEARDQFQRLVEQAPENVPARVASASSPGAGRER
jgi:Flp pilus assembly protein TadD